MTSGTLVTNPTHHRGQTGYTNCSFCGRRYTALGIGRHWAHCDKNPNRISDSDRPSRGRRKDIAHDVIEEILGKGLAVSSWRDYHPKGYEDLLLYRADLVQSVLRVLERRHA